jgi:hypothetical protein
MGQSMAQLRVVLAVLIVLAGIAAACVPEPRNRASPSLGDTTATPTPVPTPAGPTPTPSFVRPTPTPEPTFLAYVVKSGDTLDKIARRHQTSVRSIAYWNRATYPSLDPDSSDYRPNDIKVGWTLLIHPNSEVDPENLPAATSVPETPTPAPTAQF